MRQAVIQGGMLRAGDRVIVSVSGGPDSVALLDALHRLAPDWALSLHVFHLNHGLRGAESDADAEYVRELAARLGLPCTVITLPYGELKGEPGSLQANARRRRYQELNALALSIGATKVATGHNRDDQAETVLMRLLRGAGPDGLAGIPAVRTEGQYTLIRPLLTTPRSEIEGYCFERELSPRFDASNSQANYTRNRLRLELMPLLAREYNPSVAESLAQLAGVLREENDLLERMAFEAYERCRLHEDPQRIGVKDEQNPVVVLNGARLLAEPLALARRVVRLAARNVLGPEVNLGLPAVTRVLDTAGRTDGSCVLGLQDGLRLSCEYGRLHFAASSQHCWVTPPEGGWPVRVPGETAIPNLGITITAEVAVVDDCTGKPAPEAFCLDADLLPGPLAIRFRMAGDRIWPVGMEGSKKIQDILVDAKVPRTRRESVPLLVAGNAVIWVIGHRLDRRFLATAETRRLIRVNLSRSL